MKNPSAFLAGRRGFGAAVSGFYGEAGGFFWVSPRCGHERGGAGAVGGGFSTIVWVEAVKKGQVRGLPPRLGRFPARFGHATCSAPGRARFFSSRA